MPSYWISRYIAIQQATIYIAKHASNCFPCFVARLSLVFWISVCEWQRRLVDYHDSSVRFPSAVSCARHYFAYVHISPIFFYFCFDSFGRFFLCFVIPYCFGFLRIDFRFALSPPSVIAASCVATALFGLTGVRNNNQLQKQILNKLSNLTCSKTTDLIEIHKSLESIVREQVKLVKPGKRKKWQRNRVYANSHCILLRLLSHYCCHVICVY